VHRHHPKIPLKHPHLNSSVCSVWDKGYRYGFNTQEKDEEIAKGHYTAEYWEYDSRLGRRWNPDPVVKEWESSYACLNNNPICRIDFLGNDAEDVKENKPINNEPLPEYEFPGGSITKSKTGFWSKALKSTIKIIDNVSDFMPIVSGLKQTVKSLMVGDWEGAALGLGETLLDGVLLLTTAGVGNLYKVGAKVAIKTGTKIFAKETGENIIGSYVNEGATKIGIPKSLQISTSILFGIHAKINYSNNAVKRAAKNKCKTFERIDPIKTDPSGNPLHNGQREITFTDGRSLQEDGTWKHGPNGGPVSSATLSKKEREFLQEIGWGIPK